MKKTVLCIIIVVLFVLPATCFSSYLIKLKNGGEFVTDQYWEENNHIRFYAYGGLVDFPKSDVHTITDSNLTVPKESISQPVSNESSTANTSSANSQNPNSAKNTPAETEMTDTSANETAQKESEKKEADKKKNEQQMVKLNASLEGGLDELRQATRNRDDEGKKIARKKISEITNQIYDLKDKMEPKAP